ncbi:MAG: uracil-DNA glycosylase, partial [Gemmobacter sp.]
MNLPDPPAAWADLPFFSRDWPTVSARLRAEPRMWLPGPDRLFRALDLCPPDRVRVVILGQDPYPNPAHAMGLAFSVPPGTRTLPRSLANILKELSTDLQVVRKDGDLSGWARQGVLLLNPVLSVPQGESHGHRGIGWQPLAREVL